MDIEFVHTLPTEASLSVLTTDFDNSIWGSDATQVWGALRHRGPIVWPKDGLAACTSSRSIDEALHDPAVFSSNPEAMYFGSDAGAIPLQVDPPEHSRFRKMLDLLFAPKRMAAKEAEVTALTNRLIDRFIDRGSVDFSEEFAVIFPSQVFLSLMGLPIDDLGEFLKVKHRMIRPAGDDEAARRDDQMHAAFWIFNYFAEAIAEREEDPGDDILGHFIAMEREGRLTRDETLNICLLFLPAGLDTVTASLECAFAFLAEHPVHRQQLVDNPDLGGRAIEELLRYSTPVPMVPRIAMTDTTLDGCPVAAGTRLRVMLSVFNQDPERFANPEQVDFHRADNPHITFGGGVHRCVGSHLARLEMRVALREWHRRIPDYRLASGTTPQYRQAIREISHLSLEFDPIARMEPTP
jgi:cytochrome P450